MGRKKLISDEELMLLFDNYLVEKCDGRIEMYKIPEFGTHLRSTGFPNVSDRILRRNEYLSKHVESLREASFNEDFRIVAVFNTIDIEKFIAKNNTVSKMKQALSSLNMYYKSVCESAMRLNTAGTKAIEMDEKKSRLISQLEKQVDEYNKDHMVMKDKLTDLEKENYTLKKIIDTYVYPEIANELLEKAGLIKIEDKIIKDSALDEDIIQASTKIKSDSNVIKGLFNDFN